jgi:hypothetical protein
MISPAMFARWCRWAKRRAAFPEADFVGTYPGKTRCLDSPFASDVFWVHVTCF